MAHGCYAGSLIQLDFGESEQTKQAVLVTIANDVQTEPRELPGGRPLVDFGGTLDEFEARARSGSLDGCILRARVASDDPIPDLADRLREWSPDCAVFDLSNPITNQSVKAIDNEEADVEERGIDELFMEWRTTRAFGMSASHEAVAALFREAQGAGPGATPDFGLTSLRTAAEKTLGALAAERSRT